MSDRHNNDNSENKKPKIEFAPGCFDEFEGTQEELDELVAQLTAMAESGELLEKSVSVEDLGDFESVEEFIESVAEMAEKADEEYGFDEEGFVKFPFNNTRH